jgi:hypothetical protein
MGGTPEGKPATVVFVGYRLHLGGIVKAVHCLNRAGLFADGV